MNIFCVNNNNNNINKNKNNKALAYLIRMLANANHNDNHNNLFIKEHLTIAKSQKSFSRCFNSKYLHFNNHVVNFVYKQVQYSAVELS